MRKYLGICLGLMGLGVSGLDSQEAYPLTLAQRDQLRQYIPRTFSKLDGQRPVHIVALGDSVTWMYTLDENNGNWLKSYLGHFGDRLARQFFYTGGVRALNPEKNHPAKLKEHLGKEIYIENLAIGGRGALDALQRVTTDAFVNGPDLVVIEYGVNDAMRGFSLHSYRESLQRSIDACRANRVDVMIVAPNIIRSSSGPTGWGLTRTHATIAREVAKKNDVFFADLGTALARLGGGIPSGVEPEAAILTMADRLARIFEFEPPPESPEVLHPNEKAHAVMGRHLFEALVEGPKDPAPYSVVGRGVMTDNGQVKVRVSLRNQSDTERKGYVGALMMGHLLTPAQPYRSFELKPKQNVEFDFDYLRVAAQNVPGGNAAFDVADPNLRLSYFVVDEGGSHLLDFVSRLEPVSIEWISQEFHNVSDGVRFEWQFVNGVAAPTRGKYRIGMGESASEWVPFDLDPLGSKKFQATFPFKAVPGAARFKTPVFVDIEVGGKTITFPRELEAVRDVTLGQRIALSALDTYSDSSRDPLAGMESLPEGEVGIAMRIDADESFLFLTFDIEGVPFTGVEGVPTLSADIALDARPSNVVGSFGFVDKLRVNTGTSDGPATVDRIQLGAFGDGYNMVLMPEGVTATLETRSADSKRLSVRIPRAYLFRHEWQIGSAASVLGLNVGLGFVGIDPDTGKPYFPSNLRYVHTSPNAGLDRNLYFRDARGLGRLRLTTAPVATWSAHLY